MKAAILQIFAHSHIPQVQSFAWNLDQFFLAQCRGGVVRTTGTPFKFRLMACHVDAGHDQPLTFPQSQASCEVCYNCIAEGLVERLAVAERWLLVCSSDISGISRHQPFDFVEPIVYVDKLLVALQHLIASNEQEAISIRMEVVTAEFGIAFLSEIENGSRGA